MELIDLIHYENEKTGLDFKAVIYKADKFDDLLKDIMAMANAALEEDRYIVVGVKHHPRGLRIKPRERSHGRFGGRRLGVVSCSYRSSPRFVVGPADFQAGVFLAARG